jgi:hypothetical protein
MPYFSELRPAFQEFRGLLTGKGEISDRAVDAVYNGHFRNDKFRTHRVKSRPQFDKTIYPSLFETLAILPNGQPVNCEALPELSDSWNSFNPELAGNSLARVLLGFIWKQGDINTLRHVFDGLHGKPLLSDNGTVMYQFGRHLANPFRQPIFDQHTYRAYRLLDAFDEWEDRAALSTLFKECDGFQSGNTLPPGALGSYLNWWNAEIAARAPENASAWLATISATDRLLFSLGKAAKLQINA